MKVSATHLTDRAGITLVTGIFHSLGWLVREQPISDTGIDAHVEVVEGGKATGRLLALQIKSGPSYFRETDGDCVVYRGDKDHLDYWLKHTLPVVIVLVEPASGKILWQPITEETVEPTPKGWKTEVPTANVLDSTTAARFRALAEGRPALRRLSQLQEGLPWMRALAAGRQVRIEADEWVNKTSGRGTIRLVVAKDGADVESHEWDVLAGGISYTQLFVHLFPWADLSIDHDYYEEHDRERFDSECGIRLDDDHVWHDQTFAKWRAEQGSTEELRPYGESGGGELAHWRLLADLNELGRGFLVVEHYLRNGR
jgi:hypothetical protein